MGGDNTIGERICPPSQPILILFWGRVFIASMVLKISKLSNWMDGFDWLCYLRLESIH